MTRSRVSLAAIALLSSAVLTACGGSSGAPSDASQEDFCEAQMSLFSDLDITDPESVPSGEDMVTAIHDWADRIEEVGTPSDLSDDAREGFEEFIDQARDIDADDFDSDDLSELGEELSDDANKKIEAYSTYVTENCSGSAELPEMPEMSEMPGMSESPSQ